MTTATITTTNKNESKPETFFLGEGTTFVGIDNRLMPELREIATGLNSTVSDVVNEALDRWLEVEGVVVRQKFEEERTKGSRKQAKKAGKKTA